VCMRFRWERVDGCEWASLCVDEKVRASVCMTVCVVKDMGG
jgi:hypothetical protein